MITLRRAATFVIVLSALALSGIPPAGADPGTINLSWDDCSTFGTSAKTFACNVNTGPAFNLIGSFTPPEAMPLFVGLSAALTVQSSTATLPDWWRFGSSECRGSALSVAFDYTSGPFSCLDPYSGNALGGLLYTIGFGGVDRASLRLQGAIPLGFDFLIEPENEYYGFTIRIRRSNTAGAGSCSGCEVPMTIHLDEIGLFQSSEINHRLTMPGHGTTVTWSGEPVPPEAPDIVSFSPAGGTAGTEVTVQGQRFTGTTSVTFGSQSASFEVESDQIIKTTAPPNVHTSHIIVTTPGGSDQSDEAFVVPDTPTSEGINLSWDDCGLNGSTDMAVVCDSNEGSPFSMVVSFAPPPGLDSLWAAEGEIDVFSASETLPDWWRMGIGQCRGFEALRAETGFSSGPYSCFAFWDESAFAGATIGQDPDHPNRGRLSFSCATSIGFEGPVDPSHEYYVMRINIMRMKTTGPDACGGCEVPACIVLNSITMSQALGSTYNPILTMPKDRNVIRWGSPPDCPIRSPSSRVSPGSVARRWRKYGFANSSPGPTVPMLPCDTGCTRRQRRWSAPRPAWHRGCR